MGERQRVEGMHRALRKGAKAFTDGAAVTANPYKDPSIALNSTGMSWSLYPFWRMGWNNAKNEHDKAAKAIP